MTADHFARLASWFSAPRWWQDWTDIAFWLGVAYVLGVRL